MPFHPMVGLLILVCSVNAWGQSTWIGTEHGERKIGDRGQAMSPQRPYRAPVGDKTPGDHVLRIFSEISQFPRPSRGEERIRDYVFKDAKRQNAARWKGKICLCSDSVGNVAISIPATGRFSGEKLLPVVLQAHMDIVQTVKGATAGEDLTPYFKKGVSLSDTDGWLHSTDHRTTLGADDGIGVAMALRYLEEPSVEHPPLEIALTVDEEDTWTGIRNFRCPLHPGAAISLDQADGENEFITGTQGYGDIRVTGQLPIEPLPEGTVLLTVKINKLKGGHSGIDIAKNRANAALLGAKILDAVLKKNQQARLVGFRGGNAANAIPSSMEFTLSVPKTGLRESQDRIRAVFLDQSRNFPGDFDPTKPEETLAHLSYEERGDALGRTGIQPKAARRLLTSLLRLRDGVINRDREFPDGSRGSSNLGLLEVGQAIPGKASVPAFAHFLVRGFDTKQIRENTKANIEELIGGLDGGRVESEDFAPAWVADKDSWLLKLLRERFPQDREHLTLGVIELSELSNRYPEVPMLALGPKVENKHSSEERLKLDSVDPTVKKLDKMLAAVGSASRFRQESAKISKEFPEACKGFGTSR